MSSVDKSIFYEKQNEITKKLTSLLALRDLTTGAITFENSTQDTKLALQIDPVFSDDARDSS